jgi:hypothetical protein
VRFLFLLMLIGCTYKPATVSGSVYQCPESLLQSVEKKLEECVCQRQ